MDLIDRIRELSLRIPGQLEHLATEEATKTALVMPFIQALGYNVFDPKEVIPEFTADVGTKRGERVDYAIVRDGSPIMLFECKSAKTNLDDAHASQLYRYFSVTPARFGILTNGIEYRFFGDLEAANKMDARPFFEFDLTRFDDKAVEELKKFAKGSFDVEQILSTASELKYTKGIVRLLSEEWVNPSDEFVRLFAARVYEGRLTQSVKEQFTQIVKRAFQEFVRARINERLQTALDRSDQSDEGDKAQSDGEPEAGSEEREIATTDEELQGYYIVKGIVGEVIDVRRIFMRDSLSYCGVIVDDNNRKPICRMWFNRSQKYIGLFDEGKSETRHAIADLNGIYAFAEQLRASARRWVGS